LPIYSEVKPCPVARLFGASLRLNPGKRFNGFGKNLCPMVEVSCCTSRSFGNMNTTWYESLYPLE